MEQRRSVSTVAQRKEGPVDELVLEPTDVFVGAVNAILNNDDEGVAESDVTPN